LTGTDGATFARAVELLLVGAAVFFAISVLGC
jgi:hypothetical protein